MTASAQLAQSERLRQKGSAQVCEDEW